jgi:hypothetical protein
MAFKRSKDTYVSIDDVDLSTFTDSSEIGRKIDTSDVTTYGKNSHVYSTTLMDGTGKISGTYDDSEAGPRATLTTLLAAGETVTFVRRPEGTGAGLPQDSVEVIVSSYTETNAVADMIKWSAELQFAGDVDTTPQAG